MLVERIQQTVREPLQNHQQEIVVHTPDRNIPIERRAWSREAVDLFSCISITSVSSTPPNAQIDCRNVSSAAEVRVVFPALRDCFLKIAILCGEPGRGNLENRLKQVLHLKKGGRGPAHEESVKNWQYRLIYQWIITRMFQTHGLHAVNRLFVCSQTRAFIRLGRLSMPANSAKSRRQELTGSVKFSTGRDSLVRVHH